MKLKRPKTDRYVEAKNDAPHVDLRGEQERITRSSHVFELGSGGVQSLNDIPRSPDTRNSIIRHRDLTGERYNRLRELETA